MFSYQDNESLSIEASLYRERTIQWPVHLGLTRCVVWLGSTRGIPSREINFKPSNKLFQLSGGPSIASMLTYMHTRHFETFSRYLSRPTAMACKRLGDN